MFLQEFVFQMPGLVSDNVKEEFEAAKGIWNELCEFLVSCMQGSKHEIPRWTPMKVSALHMGTRIDIQHWLKVVDIYSNEVVQMGEKHNLRNLEAEFFAKAKIRMHKYLSLGFVCLT